MSHDGCEEVAWKGKAFSYLMHHPNSFLQTENYGSKRQQEAAGGHAVAVHQGSDSTAKAGTGTWNGPAPRGALNGAAATTAPAAVSARQPDFVHIGPTAARMPLLGLGTYGITSPDVVKTALALGYRHIDCATFYGNQDVIGQGLKDFIAEGKRDQLFITSKIWVTEKRPAAAREACERTITQLGCQYLDLLLIHWPETAMPEWKFGDPFLPDASVTLKDTWGALEELVDQGLVKSIGVSNFSLKDVEELLSQCRIKPAANQVELHPYLPQRKLVGTCFRKGVQCVAYSPLGGQGAAGPKSTLLSDPTVMRVAQETGKTPAQVLLRYNMQRGVPVVPKASSEAHLRQNIEGAFEWALTQEQKAALDAMETGQRFVTLPFHPWTD